MIKIKNTASKAIMLASALAGSIALATVTFDARADDSGSKNTQKAEFDGQGHFDCKCKTSGSDCRCMVS